MNVGAGGGGAAVAVAAPTGGAGAAAATAPAAEEKNVFTLLHLYFCPIGYDMILVLCCIIIAILIYF